MAARARRPAAPPKEYKFFTLSSSCGAIDQAEYSAAEDDTFYTAEAAAENAIARYADGVTSAGRIFIVEIVGVVQPQRKATYHAVSNIYTIPDAD